MIPTSRLAVLIVSLEEMASKQDASNVDCAENALQIERPLFRSAERLEHLRRIADETARKHHIQLGHDDEYDEPGFVSLYAMDQITIRLCGAIFEVICQKSRCLQ